MVCAPDLNWLFLDLNSYFASVEQQVEPRLRGRPVAVSALKGSDASCAIAASYEAKAYGIKTGTPIWEARRMCPGLVVVPARHDMYVEFHHKILAEMERHLPITQVCSVDEAACRLRGRDRQPEVAIAIARAMKSGIRARVGQAIQCSIGIAPSRLLAKIATDMQKPDGLTVLMPDALPGRLLDLKLTDLPGISVGMERRLWRHRITTVEQFWHLSPRRARAIWGSVLGERFWRAFRGEDIEVWSEAPHKRSVSHSHMLPPAMRPAPQARKVLRRLAQKAAARLRRHACVTPRLWVMVRCQDGQGLATPRWAQEIKMAPTDDTLAILAAVDQLWAGFNPPDHLQIKKVGVALVGLSPKGDVPDDLLTWATAPDHAPQRQALWQGVDHLNARYGKDTVTVGMPKTVTTDYVGAKIAFNRIPEIEEFYE